MKNLNLISFIILLFQFMNVQAQEHSIPADWASAADGTDYYYVVDDPSGLNNLTFPGLIIEKLQINDRLYDIGDADFSKYGGGSDKLLITAVNTDFQNGGKDLNKVVFQITDDDTNNPKTIKITIVDRSKSISQSSGQGGNAGGNQGVQKKLPSDILAQQERIRQYIGSTYSSEIRERDKRHNLILSDNTVHIFMDEYGKTYFTGFPTTAREDYNYTLHVFYDAVNTTTKSIDAQFQGDYNPVFSIYGEEINIHSETDSEKSNPSIRIKEVVFDNEGPYTESFTLKVTKLTQDDDVVIVIPTKTIKIAPVHHVSVMVGLVGSYLSNPTDITIGVNDSGDTTLFANDPETRGLITLMAVFYPKPRNLLFPPKQFFSWERLGFVVGTRIDTDLTENFLGGLSYDLARGLCLTGGVHYGRVNTVAGRSDFNFGKDLFTGELVQKKEWQANYFVGVSIDLRVFGVLFNPAGQTK